MDNGNIVILILAILVFGMEIVWSLFLYILKRLDRYFNKKLINQLWEENKMSYLNLPDLLIDDKGREYWL